MSKKKAIDISTKGWSKEEIESLRIEVNNRNFKWVAKAISKTGKIKWFYAHTKVDVEIFAIQEGYKILKVNRKN